MTFEEWYDGNRDDLIDAPNTQTVSELTWRACEEATKQACAEATCELCLHGTGTCIFRDKMGCADYRAVINAEVK